MKNKIICELYKLYNKYGVDTKFLDSLDDEKKIKGMKGVLAMLDLNKMQEYDKQDLEFIRKIYSKYC